VTSVWQSVKHNLLTGIHPATVEDLWTGWRNVIFRSKGGTGFICDGYSLVLCGFRKIIGFSLPSPRVVYLVWQVELGQELS